MLENEKPTLNHSDECTSDFRRCMWDKTCPRCSVLSKIVALLRRNIHNGCSVSESVTAARLAATLIEKYQVVPVEIRDNQRILAPQLKVVTVNRKTNKTQRRTVAGEQDEMEGLDENC
jgi:hypothetical protein